MASIAGLSLLIGGIGIMNIMLANVYDRRKEIGTRRALGARRADIMGQFVLEAATLTTLGGIVGVGVGYGLARIISAYAEWPTIISTSAILLGLAISSLTGIIFGWWPARQAARTNPIEALRGWITSLTHAAQQLIVTPTTVVDVAQPPSAVILLPNSMSGRMPVLTSITQYVTP